MAATTNQNHNNDDEERKLNLKEGAAPDPVGVYDRPERSGPSTASIIITVVVLLLLLAVAYYALQAFVF